MNRIVILLFSVLLLFSCNKAEPRKPVIRKTSTFMKESIERNQKINQLEEEILRLKLQKDSVNNYITSDFGFWYFYNQKDSLTASLPETGDEVLFTYEVKRINDSIVFNESQIGDQSYIVDKQELITGLQDGIKLMKEGETVTFLFPSHKAYGYSGAEGINPNEPLIYKVKLKKIIKNKSD
ncbi:gliding motility-associated peptidyl-prolyl isomerase GldI [Namhaeicola litoreus]|uniref:Peptidyl-prolyl cis-trans isomerase n=1 Tax=Namhaeicola litoreus TaxID=1052145 RepID=A0ABW3Y4J9_9FLAO